MPWLCAFAVTRVSGGTGNEWPEIVAVRRGHLGFPRAMLKLDRNYCICSSVCNGLGLSETSSLQLAVDNEESATSVLRALLCVLNRLTLVLIGDLITKSV